MKITNLIPVKSVTSFLCHKIFALQMYNELKLGNYQLNTLSSTLSNLKRVLKIIYEYHKNKKKILVLGDSLINQGHQKTYEQGNHNYLAYSAWINGLITNTSNACKFKELEIEQRRFLKTIKKPDLVILTAYFDKILNEVYKFNIPNIITNITVKQKYLNLNNLTAAKSILLYKETDQSLFEKFFCGLIEKIFISVPTQKKTGIRYIYANVNNKIRQKPAFRNQIKKLTSSEKVLQSFYMYLTEKKNDFYSELLTNNFFKVVQMYPSFIIETVHTLLTNMKMLEDYRLHKVRQDLWNKNLKKESKEVFSLEEFTTDIPQIPGRSYRAENYHKVLNHFKEEIEKNKEKINLIQQIRAYNLRIRQLQKKQRNRRVKKEKTKSKIQNKLGQPWILYNKHLIVLKNTKKELKQKLQNILMEEERIKEEQRIKEAKELAARIELNRSLNLKNKKRNKKQKAKKRRYKKPRNNKK